MDIFNYSDYRKIIKLWIEARPGKGRGEYTKMAEMIAVPQSVFSLMMSGQRDLAPDHACILSEYMQLLPLEQEYFISLVQLEKAYHHKFKTYLQDKIARIKRESLSLVKRVNTEQVFSPEDQQIFYSSWLYSAIRLRTSFEDGASLQNLMEEFQITSERLISILDFLLRTGLIIQEKNHYKIGALRTHLGKDSPMISRHHINWRAKSIERTSEIKDEELMFTGPLTCSHKDFAIIREKVAALIKETSEIVKDSPAETLAYLGMDLYKL